MSAMARMQRQPVQGIRFSEGVGQRSQYEHSAQGDPPEPAAVDAGVRTDRFDRRKGVADAHTLLFVLAVLAIVPLAALLSHATESVAEKTGDAVGGLLNATLGNLTELIIAIAALHAGQYTLVKASIAGAIVTNTLFMLGASFLLGGLKHHIQDVQSRRRSAPCRSVVDGHSCTARPLGNH